MRGLPAGGVLDEMLPAIDTGTLAKLLELPPDERPVEDLFYEFKEVWTPKHVGKTVAAFANTMGGFLMFGAKAVAGRLDSFPGLKRGPEWPLLVANNIVGNVSALPHWEPYARPETRRQREDRNDL